MAHWAEINDQNIVTRVVVTDNNHPDGDEGYSWLVDTFGGTWLKTSYNTKGGVHALGGTPFRMNYAEVGSQYDSVKDRFLPFKQIASWVLDEETCTWVAPKPMPTESSNGYCWNEELVDWVEIDPNNSSTIPVE